MKEKRDCNIVQDLLPNYIESLTREETNEFIKEHLEKCNECKKILESMEKDLKIENIKKENKEVKYIKKYSNKLKILKMVLLIIFILLVIFLGVTIRKMLIIKNLNNKVSRYVDTNNYYIKIMNNSGETTTLTEYYSKGDKAVLFLNTKIKNTDQTRKLTNYYKGEKANTYIESNENKVALLDSNGVPSKINIVTLDYGNNVWFLFQQALATSIKSGEYNGKDCYILSLGKNSEAYIEKETGLRVKAKEGITVEKDGNEIPTTVEYYYQFGSVGDEIFVEPNIDEYEVQK